MKVVMIVLYNNLNLMNKVLFVIVFYIVVFIVRNIIKIEKCDLNKNWKVYSKGKEENSVKKIFRYLGGRSKIVKI